jgi:hypothetical protein
MADPNKPIENTQYTVDGEQPSIVPQGTNNGGGSTTTTPPPVVNEPPKTDSTTTTTNNTTTISSTVPQQYKVSDNGELITYLEQLRDQYEPLSKEDLAKLRRKQRIEGIISGVAGAAQSIANLYYTTQYAPNMYNANEGLSAKAKERFDKEKAEREAKDKEFFNYAMQIAKLKGEDTDRNLKVWQTEQTFARQDRDYDTSRQDRADDVAFRDKSFDRDENRWERQFKESIRQFNVSSANEKTKLSLEAQRLAHELQNGSMTFNLGSNGNVTLSADKLNAETVSRIYNSLEDEFKYDYEDVDKKDANGNTVKDANGNTVKEKVRVPRLKGESIVKNGLIVGNKPPTTEAMLIAIGEYVGKSPALQESIKQVAGIDTTKPAAY